jgi:hypothetical protein
MQEHHAGRIEGYAIVSEDGMLATAAGIMPGALKFDADAQFFEAGLNGVDVVVHGRHSEERQPNSPQRRRIILSLVRRICGSSAETVGGFRGTPGHMRGAGEVGLRSGCCLTATHRTAGPSVPRPRGSPSSPAPAAHRCAAVGLDRDAHGREFCIGAVNDAVGSSPRRSFERCGRG